MGRDLILANPNLDPTYIKITLYLIIASKAENKQLCFPDVRNAFAALEVQPPKEGAG